jgi:endonuclease YncB( thermonuclease family)
MLREIKGMGSMVERLRSADGADYPLGPIGGLRGLRVITFGRVTANADAETADLLMLEESGALRKHRARLLGYDSPDFKGSNLDPRHDEKRRKAQIAKHRLRELCADRILRVESHGEDEQGRVLVALYPIDWADGRSVNRCMIDEGHGTQSIFGAPL